MEAPVGAGAGAICAAHEGAQATGTCARCGDFVCPLCLDPIADHDDWCEKCREREGGDRMPWEREEGGILTRWWRTTRGVLLEPGLTFGRARPASLRKALLYNALTGVIVGALFTLLGAFGLALLLGVGGFEELAAEPAFAGLGTEVAVAIVVTILLAGPLLYPLYSLFLVALRGAIYWVALQIVGGGGDHKAPFWTVSYLGAIHLTMLPLQLLNEIPAFGPFIALLGHLAVEIWYALQLTGAAERYHGLSQGRAAFAGWSFFLILCAFMLSCCCLGAFTGAMSVL